MEECFKLLRRNRDVDVLSDAIVKVAVLVGSAGLLPQHAVDVRGARCHERGHKGRVHVITRRLAGRVGEQTLIRTDLPCVCGKENKMHGQSFFFLQKLYSANNVQNYPF